MSKQIKGLRYPHLCYLHSDTWVRRLALSPEDAQRYHGLKKLCFWALRLLADKMIDWDTR